MHCEAYDTNTSLQRNSYRSCRRHPATPPTHTNQLNPLILLSRHPFPRVFQQHHQEALRKSDHKRRGLYQGDRLYYLGRMVVLVSSGSTYQRCTRKVGLQDMIWPSLEFGVISFAFSLSFFLLSFFFPSRVCITNFFE